MTCCHSQERWSLQKEMSSHKQSWSLITSHHLCLGPASSNTFLRKRETWKDRKNELQGNFNTSPQIYLAQQYVYGMLNDTLWKNILESNNFRKCKQQMWTVFLTTGFLRAFNMLNCKVTFLKYDTMWLFSISFWKCWVWESQKLRFTNLSSLKQ